MKKLIIAIVLALGLVVSTSSGAFASDLESVTLAKPKCSVDNSVHSKEFNHIFVTNTVHYRWCIGKKGTTWSTPLSLILEWETLNDEDAKCHWYQLGGPWSQVRAWTYFGDWRGHHGKKFNQVECVDDKSQGQHIVKIGKKKRKRYYWSSSGYPPWSADLTVARTGGDRDEHGTLYGHLTPFEIPVRHNVTAW